MAKKIFLFEVSWEVCNFVGGINTVILSKIKQAVERFEQDYILIGPLLDNNDGFVEQTTEFLKPIEQLLQEEKFPCQIGYWDIAEKPPVILVDFRDRHNIEPLLYNLWTNFSVDSLEGGFDYQEPILFATACAELITIIAKQLFIKNKQVVAHFHEWMSGAGVLYIKQHMPIISTVFTTHATVLGRALSSANQLIFDLPAHLDVDDEAKRFSVFSKHSLERASAKYADCFTTVSNITADESNIILNKYPDKIAFNGLDIEKIQHSKIYTQNGVARERLISIAGKIIGKAVDSNALIWMTSGRYEFHNKGFDVFLKSLAKLEERLPPDSPEIVVFFLVAVHDYSKADSLLEGDYSNDPGQGRVLGLATHRVDNPDVDPIVSVCNSLNLRDPNRKIHIIYSNAFLNGSDGVFDFPYEEALTACDLTVFPSYYEPWGYTPLESIAYGTPTVTTDLAGFGCWIQTLKHDYQEAVFVLNRRNSHTEEVVDSLCQHFELVAQQDRAKKDQIRKKASLIAKLADWKYFFEDYVDAYEQSIAFNEIYYKKFISEERFMTCIREAESNMPRLRAFSYETLLPEKLRELRKFANNFWWSWHPESAVLFQEIDSELWEKVSKNPIAFLNNVSNRLLVQMSNDQQYMEKYHTVLEKFNAYAKPTEICNICESAKYFSPRHPIAYFCMEYALDESLPIYSGGLGVLAGDYLKTMSDLNVPFVAVGLFYKQGYFQQEIDFHGGQITTYRNNNPTQLSIAQVSDEHGKPLSLNIRILERTITGCAWEVKVGRISLYLLDTDVPENNADDRKITARLYAGGREQRIKQEIVLGIGGVRLLTEKLNIHPAVYHLNEGHSAFLLLERVRNFCQQHKLSIHEACQAVQASSVFTTHTPVAAGNEAFSEKMISKYFSEFTDRLGVSMEGLLKRGRSLEPNSKVFSMTVLSMRLSAGINAVSELHGKVSRAMWAGIWSGFLKHEAPIEDITNGVHIATWMSQSMQTVCNKYLGSDWLAHQQDKANWEKIHAVPDVEIWQTHKIQKEKLLAVVKNRIMKEYPFRNEREKLINESLACLQGDALVLGFARRFAIYKRMNLILRDKERLAKMLNNADRPIIMLIAGKAHPEDKAGQQVLQNIIESLRDPIFNGRVIFLENYDMGLAKLLTSGVDVWLNTPILGREASGTSGMKVGVNGGLNFSIEDGWWAEAYESEIGWNIRSFDNLPNYSMRNDMEAMMLLDNLELSVLPLYYENRSNGFNPDWVRKMKNAMSSIAGQYNSYRMASEYFGRLYCPVVHRYKQLIQHDYKLLRDIVKWRWEVLTGFNTVKIKSILINGIQDGKITSNGLIEVKILLFSGKLKAHELKAEFILGKSDDRQFIEKPAVIPLQLADTQESGILTYISGYELKDTGLYRYGVRVYPYHPLMIRPQEAGVVYWG